MFVVRSGRFQEVDDRHPYNPEVGAGQAMPEGVVVLFGHLYTDDLRPIETPGDVPVIGGVEDAIPIVTTARELPMTTGRVCKLGEKCARFAARAGMTICAAIEAGTAS
jgi:hypothetical protein